MKKKKHVFGVHVFGVGMMGLAAIAGFSAITMLLWNWLVPCIFGLAVINFWQALGLLVFVRILFGGIGAKNWMGMAMNNHRNPIREKWMKMTPEERQEFVKDRRFGHHPFGRNFGHGFDDRFNPEEPEKKD
jgi:hypothetical protein